MCELYVVKKSKLKENEIEYKNWNFEYCRFYGWINLRDYDVVFC